ncbi:MAG: ABC-2 type transport system permease protein [Saprospiraceae bacterium]|jgi:ABC-2 type transport system permease protein
MSALQENIREDKINEVLRTFAEAKAYQEAPYTSTLEFVGVLNDVTPDSLSYLIVNMDISVLRPIDPIGS